MFMEVTIQKAFKVKTESVFSAIIPKRSQSTNEDVDQEDEVYETVFKVELQHYLKWKMTYEAKKRDSILPSLVAMFETVAA
jgi:hypothetical protein